VKAFVLRDANVLDQTGVFAGPQAIGVVDGIVVEVGPNVSMPEAVSIDFADTFVMPGVFDCHLHVAASSLDAMELMRTPITQWTLEAAQNMRRTLEAGVTFVRDAAGADAGMREAVERGFTPGPRLQVAVVALSQTGGHVDGFLPGPGFEISADYVMPEYPGRPPYVVDGVEGMRRTVRAVLRAGADWIKLCTTGGILSAHDEGDVPEFTPEEIEVAVYEGARKRKGVMVHAFGGEGIDNAVRAGVRSVEHGIFLTEEQAALMAERGCFLVPTLAILRDVIAWAEAGLVAPYAIRKALDLKARIGSAVRIAREAGVKIALGTD
jgi:imidazolonepropionase-like amidohydrolase